MGVYDTVGKRKIQIKCTPEPQMAHYDIGDEILLKDGLYIGYEGWFTAKNKRVLDCGKNIYTKWGDKMSLEKALASSNPVAIVCERWEELKKVLYKMDGVIKKVKEFEWLNSPNKELNNDTPFEVISRGPEGVKQVLELLHNIKYGIPT